MPDPNRPDTSPDAAPKSDTGTQPIDTAPPSRFIGRSVGPTLSPGASLGGFRIVRLLGVGGMGAVYLAADPKLGRQVAVKTMKPELAADPAAKDRFLREARATAAVEHENVVAVYGVGEEGDTPYLVMPLLKGEPLADRLKRGPIPLADACHIARDITAGLAAAHDQGLIHRDVKPTNVWLDPDGKAKILDFGLARPMEAGEGLTALGAIVGTPAYMAPEQAGGDAVDARADLFSLGCVLYELVTGRRPFDGATVLAVLSSLANHVPPSADRVNPSVPPELARLIDRLLSKPPAGRPASAKEVAALLMMIEAGVKTSGVRAIPIDPPPPVVGATGLIWSALTEDDIAAAARPPAPPPAGSKRWVVPALIAAGLLAVVGAVVAFLVFRGGATTGTLVIDADDPDVEVVVRQRGTTVQPRTTQREIELPAGDYEIELAGKADGLRLSTRRFRITKGGRETVTVSRVPTPRDPARADADRAAAAEAAFPELARKLFVPGVTFAAAAADVQAFLGTHGGTPAAVRAADRLTKLPSPLDALDPAKIPEDAKAAWRAAGFHQADVVAVLGEHRQRHWGPVAAVAHHPTRDVIASLGDDGGIGLWDGKTMDPLGVLRSEPGGFSGMAFVPDGRHLLAAGASRLEVWDLDTRQRTRKIDTAEDEVLVMAFVDPNRVVTGGRYGRVSLWDLGTGKLVRPLGGHKHQVTSVVVLPDRKTALSASADGKVHRIDLDVGGFTIHEGHEGSISGMVIDGEGKRAVTAGEGKRLLSWDVATRKPLRQFDPPDPQPRSIALRPGTSELVTGDSNGTVTRWDLGSHKAIRTWKAHPGEVGTVCFSPDGKRLVTGSDDGTVRLWDADAGTEVRPLTGPVGPTTTAAFAPDLSGLLTISRDRCRVWGWDPTAAPREYGFGDYPRRVAWFPDGKRAVLADLICHVRDFSPAAVDTTMTFNERTNPAHSADVSADGRRVAIGFQSGTVEVWDVAAFPPKSLHTIPAHLNSVGTVAFSPDGRRLATAGKKLIRVWDLSATTPRSVGELGTDLGPDSSNVYQVAWSPNGTELAVAAGAAVVHRYTLTPKGFAPGPALPNQHPGGMIGLAYSPTGSRLAGIDGLNGVAVWDTATGQRVRGWVFPGPVADVSYAADGRHVAVGNENGTVYILRVP